MKHIALVYTHIIIHRKIMSQLLKDILLWYCIPLIKHTIMKSVIWTIKFKGWLYVGSNLIEPTLKVIKPLELLRSSRSYLLKH